ncbi:threonine ammonia-lyase [Nocardiopsis synnemataformans]|uniref:threonine ammonia-lyase n=1 Tax=Nocardiopsis synnemataformans TaxID=61305 RepID=UPI003EBAC945
MLSASDMDAAARRLDGAVVRTPVVSSPGLTREVEVPVVCKTENLQHSGAFKYRGALHALLGLSDAQRARGVVGASSGNHGGALALAGHELGVPVTVVLPADVPAVKADRARALGAQVVSYDRHTQNRDTLVAELAAEHGYTIVPSADHPAVMAGAGTVAVELLSQTPGIQTLLVPVGGGGLAAGCATWLAEAAPHVRVIGVEPEDAADTAASLLAGERVRIDVPATCADGLRHTTPPPGPFEVNQRLLTGIVTVSEADIATAMRWCFEHLRLVVEPSGATALATLSARWGEIGEGPVGVVLSGGNVSRETFVRLVGEPGGNQVRGLREHEHAA